VPGGGAFPRPSGWRSPSWKRGRLSTCTGGGLTAVCPSPTPRSVEKEQVPSRRGKICTPSRGPATGSPRSGARPGLSGRVAGAEARHRISGRPDGQLGTEMRDMKLTTSICPSATSPARARSSSATSACASHISGRDARCVKGGKKRAAGTPPPSARRRSLRAR
jgi:hypothetical protein